VELFVGLGARLAEPGEFTRRAFLNGRMDLTQAEAVADLVRARSDRAQELARRQLAGELSERLQRIRQSLLEVAAELEARLDFPEEELGEADLDRLAHKTSDAEKEIAQLIAGGRRGRLYRDGVRVVLVGRPNAGKSSLFNALLGRERALVTPHPGTTRDFIEATVDVRGLPLTLVDTAGLRDSSDEIERLGIARTRGEVEAADLVLWVADINEPPNEEHDLLYEHLKKFPVALLLNKIDLAQKPDARQFEQRFGDLSRVMISARTRQGLDGLEDFLEARLLGESAGGGEESPLVSNLRHLGELERAQKSLCAGLETFRAGHSAEFIMVDLREALAALGRLLGLEVEEALLDEIFSRFCFGK
ncbi:MAG: tRNA uridine-5-carboxymethylaminomethyl(34) synthesis GTPase MnmE, partial [bacterium]